MSLAAVAAAVGAGAGANANTGPADEEPRRKVPLYTNEDLDRVSPYRDQTGVNSRPAAPPDATGRGSSTPREATSSTRRAGTGEEYWRRSWERLRDQLQPWKDRAEDLRIRIEERRNKPRVRPYSDPQIVAWQRQRDELLARVHEREDRFHERARRQGALPGWFR